MNQSHLIVFIFLFQDGRIKVGDQILAVDDEIVVGYPIEKVPEQMLSDTCLCSKFG